MTMPGRASTMNVLRSSAIVVRPGWRTDKQRHRKGRPVATAAAAAL